MEISFEGKCVLVTGAGRGIGNALVKALVKCKAKKVFALSKTKENLNKLVAEEPSIMAICVDLADWNATRCAVEKLGPIDCLVNNAAVALGGPFLNVTPEDFDTCFNVNVKSLINVSQVVVKGMMERNSGGSIVNVSSQASKMALVGHTIYSATKASMDAITSIMALELGKHNIRVNTVNPTVVMTDMSVKYWSDPKNAQPLLDRIPLHKFAECEDVVNAILFLLSDKAAMVNAANLPVEGGILAC